MSTTNQGKSLESAVLASQSVVTLVKVPNGIRYIGKGKTCATKSPVDFVGVVNGTGRAIWLDAKMCGNKTRFAIGNPAIVPTHQIEALVRAGQAGAVAGLLVEAGAHGRFLWIGWENIFQAIHMRLMPSVPWNDGWFADLGPTTHLIRFDRVPGVTK